MGRLFLLVLFQLMVMLVVSIAVLAVLFSVAVYLSQWIGAFGVLMLLLFGTGLTFYLTSIKKGKHTHDNHDLPSR